LVLEVDQCRDRRGPALDRGGVRSAARPDGAQLSRRSRARRRAWRSAGVIARPKMRGRGILSPPWES
jgi:hypothetical protein